MELSRVNEAQRSERRLERMVNPWREVVHIDLRTNSRGRDCYWLTLECGHHKYASIPGLTMLPELIRMRGPKVRSREAPRKCRCMICGVHGVNA